MDDNPQATTVARALDERATGPLVGLKILDMTSVICGAYATQMLGDLGADIIKVEYSDRGSVQGGDIMRWAGETPDKAAPGLGPIFMNLNRNKRSIVLDARDPGQRAQLKRIASLCDIVATSVRLDALTQLELDYESLRARRQDLVYVHCSGFGAGGAYEGRPAYDDLIQAASATAHINSCAEDHGSMRYTPSVIADKLCGHFMVQAILAAMLHKARTGEGQFVEVPMFECMTAFNLVEHQFGHVFDPPTGPWTYPRVANPYRKPFATKDGYIGLLPYTDAQWKAFVKAAGGEDSYGRDPRFATYKARAKNTPALFRLLEEITAARTTSEWLDLLVPLSVPVASAMRLEHLYSDAHLTSVDFFQKYNHPHAGGYVATRPPLRFSKTPANVYRHPPRLGEHGDMILREFAQSGDDDARGLVDVAARAETNI